MKTEDTRPLAQRIERGPVMIDPSNPSLLEGIKYTPTWVEDAWTEDPVAEANVELIAEAFTVCHETGRTPRELADERDELARWKAEALEVERQWDCQEVGRLLGVGLGEPIHPAIQPGIETLRKHLRRAIDIIKDEYPPCDYEIYGIPEMEAALEP